MINEYCYEKLIIGGSVESLLHSFVTNTKILILEALYPIETEELKYQHSLRLLGYHRNDTVTKMDLWNRLSFVLSLNGCLVSPNIISSHRESDNKIITITEKNKRISYEAENIMYFDKIDNNKVTMLDWFNVRSGNNHQHKTIEDPENSFINKICFYRSQRNGGNCNVKDILAISNFNHDDCGLVDHSEGIARLKVLQMMKGAGIRGQSNGYDKAGRKLHYAISIEHTYREKRKKYTPFISLKKLLNQEPEKEEQWNLTKKLFRHKQITTLQESFQLPANL
jgi:hypothetical protein